MNNKKTLVSTTIAGVMALSAFSASAADLSIKVTNLTHGIAFTPLLVASHDADTHLFKSGEAASMALQKMAEGGAIDDLADEVTTAGGHVVKNPHGKLLMPGETTEAFDFNTMDDTHLSLTAMLLPTNDAFAGTDSWKIPTEAGTYTFTVNAYDAGTEANNELYVAGAGAPGALGIPAFPVGTPGTNGSGLATEDTNKMVHIHPGNVGDAMADGGKSDLDNTVHRWLNPVLRVTVTVK
ncbi:spondin domain-containing protein [Psychrobium sp. MM17-31]|uniref:spondin domain-containing protein n=1 Tax=Psychrobium sp. MM17-31 TaxID=2917758 RepID=UPI001EF4097A|nr:spondin domain-containing protein [Psychrobium sp. MM17-31]MCG7531545.1 spondin domain-containing protein [Psychrobium sp. MM17-31]